ncbi:caspase domain-containing protein, partial [Rhodoplanes sp. TEM]
ALVIGNGAYRHATPLPNPGNDARDVARSLRGLGFDVVEGVDLDKYGMEGRIREFGKKLDRADLALFFYAGHGLQVADKNYLVPVDAKLERPGDLALDTITVDDVLAQMESDRRVNLVFLDACRDNPLARSLAASLGTRSTAVGSGLAAIQSAVGTMIVYATQPKNVALDGEGRNSPFTTALLKHIGTPGLEIGAVMKRVRADVWSATRQRQLPWDHSSLIGDVVLAR